MAYLGIDLGTSGIRALLIDEGGAPIGSAESHYSVSHPHSGWSEQEPSDWITALHIAVGALRARHPEFAGVKGIGVAGHMHGATVLDAQGDVLRPCILWNDTRSHLEAARLDAMPNVRELSGNIVFPGFTAPKLEWLRAHEPEVYAKIAKVLLPAAYLNYYLTGDYVADMSDSSGTSWLDVSARAWSEELLNAGHMRLDQMPRLVEGAQAAGQLRADLAREWGLGSVVVAGGAGDNAAAACGIGAMNAGQGFVSLGTSGVILAARDGYAPAPQTAVHTFCHAVPNRWYQMSVMLSATDSLNWLSQITVQSPAQLTGALGEVLRVPADVMFLPYLSGERTPHNDAAVRGGFVGLSTTSDVSTLTQAVLEGVSFGLRDGAEALLASGAQFDRLFAIGGGAQSRYWLTLLATVLGVPLILPKGAEFGAALGAARLGQVAAGANIAEVMTAPEAGDVVEPIAEFGPAFEAAYARFKTAYAHIKAAQGIS